MTTPLQYFAPDGTPRPSCPRCGEPLTRAVGGLLCLHCLAAIAVPSVPGPSQSPPPRRRPPYRSGEHAMAALVQARLLSEAARSITGSQCEAMALGMSPHGSGAQSIPARLDPIGDLGAAADELYAEDRLLLELRVLVPDWTDRARRCKACGHVYPASGRRCIACRTERGIDDIHCTHTGCTETRAQYTWQPCPAIHEPDDKHRADGYGIVRCGSTDWRWTAGKAERIAGDMTVRRERVWMAARKVKPAPHERRYATLCVACDLFALPHYEGGKWKPVPECPECGGRMRLGILVEERQIGGLTVGALKRWERILRGRGLI